MSRHSIVLPIVLLVAATVTIAALVQFAITFNGPPPRPAPVPIARIGEALRTGQAVQGNWRRLVVNTQATPPDARADEHPSADRDRMIAARLALPARDVRGYYQEGGPTPDDAVRGSFTIGLREAGSYRVVASAPEPVFTSWHAVTLAATLASLAVLTLLAWLIAKAISRPIVRLAAAAREARLGARASIPHQGPREVRALADAIDAMQARILEQAEGRTTMLAAIAHDLGTPLSRVAFWVEQLPDAARDRAAADIAEMRTMLGEVLRFARETNVDRTRARIDLGSLVESLAEDMSVAGMAVAVEPGPRVVVAGESQALRRLFVNLVENAVRYGGAARLSWSLAPRWAEVRIEDDGPGFGPEPEILFKPFVRGEASRNRATGGTGLGLAIVRGIAEAHGGEVVLENRDGGARVRVRLPAE